MGEGWCQPNAQCPAWCSTWGHSEPLRVTSVFLIRIPAIMIIPAETLRNFAYTIRFWWDTSWDWRKPNSVSMGYWRGNWQSVPRRNEMGEKVVAINITCFFISPFGLLVLICTPVGRISLFYLRLGFFNTTGHIVSEKADVNAEISCLVVVSFCRS